MFAETTKYKPATFIRDAVVRMGLHKRYIMPLFYSMHVVECSDIPTLATNGVTMWVNQDFWNKLSRDQRVTALAHEIGHKMLMHTSRVGTRDPYIYNIAGDHVINLMLLDSGFAALVVPNVIEWFCDPKYRGMSTEQVYDILKKEYKKRRPPPPPPGRKPPQGNGGNCTGGSPSQQQSGDENAKGDLGKWADIRQQGKGLNGEPDTDVPEGHPKGTESKAEFEGRVRRELKACETLAKIAGVGAFGVDRALQNADIAQALPWYVILEEYMRAMKSDEYDYHRIDRRAYTFNQSINPTQWTPQMGGMAWGIDCSGSISQQELAEFKTRCDEIIQQVKPEWVEAIHFHSNVFHSPRFDRGDEVVLSPHATGGTNFGAVMEHVRNMSDKPEVLVMLTDMFGPFGEDPGVPVIWVSTSSITTAPFGTVIRMHG